MATQIYVINNTVGTVLTAIQPGAANGPGLAQQSSDLKLFGLGTQRWGEGFDENFVRLAESFACPEKGSPVNTPKDSTDLGPGNGINQPLNGQLWYNTDQKKLFVFDSTGPGTWNQTAKLPAQNTQPTSPQPGDLWFDTSTLGQEQLKIFDGVNFVSVAERYLLKSGGIMTGFITLHADPTSPLHAATRQYVLAREAFLQGQIDTHETRLDAIDASAPSFLTQTTGDVRYVNITGDTMTGVLTLSGAAVTGGTQATTKNYVDAAIAAAIAPGTLGATFMRRSQNLSDVTNTTTSRSNLGLGSWSTKDQTISTGGPSGSASTGDIWIQRAP